MTLTGIRKVLLALVGLILIVVIGSTIWSPEELGSTTASIMGIIAMLMLINAEIVQRVEERLRALEDQ